MITNKKVCSKCKTEKYTSEFYKSNRDKDGYQYECKECRKNSQIMQRERSKQNIDIKDFENMTTEEACSCFKIAISTIHMYRKQGLKSKKISGIRYYSYKEMEEFFNLNSKS